MEFKIACVGEAYGEAEEREKTPFVGAAGYELTKLLAEAGINRAEVFLTNVFNLKPSGNRIETICGEKKTALPGYPALIAGKYVRAEFAGELVRLGDELLSINPNLIVCLGNTASWALLGKTAISKTRGTTDLSTHTVSGFKTLATYHPAAVLRQWELRPIVVMDLMKAKRESEYGELRRPQREIWIDPTIDDIIEFRRRYIEGCRILSIDIETSGTHITCIGFSPRRDLALVIPFVDTRRADRSYWSDATSEGIVWRIVREILGDRRIRKLFQNGMYDIAFLWRSVGIVVMNANEDSMLLHHSLQPESLKSLGFMGSIYTDEGAWKQMRKGNETIKGDD